MKTEVPVITRKKLIEVAVPLDAINAASAREKSIRHGHPSTLHLWWARRPLAAARAVIFAQMVDDPSAYPELFPTEKAQETERQRLFDIIKELVMWKNTTNEQVLERAREEIWQSWRRACAENADHPRAKELFDRYKLPAFHDPFAGGGSLPLEAQRLGLESYASDLNPVAVLINKAMIEIPPKFAGRAPVNPETREERGVVEQQWLGAQGLAEDVRYYGQWMRNEAEKRIGHLYPKVEITAEMAQQRPDLEQYVGQELTVIAWLWARTVKSPNPAFADVDVPLISNFMLSTRKGKEAYVEPVIENGGYRFVVKVGKPKDMEEKRRGTKLGRGANFECIMSETPIEPEHIYAEASAGRMGARLMAIVVEGARERVYLPPLAGMEETARQACPEWKPEVEMPSNPRWFSPPLYGLTTFGHLFTPRQLVALTTFSDLVQKAIEQVRQDAQAAGWSDDGLALDRGGSGATAYAEAVGVYLAFAVDKGADYWSSVCAWHNTRETMRNTFGRQAIPMVWDYAEGNPLSSSTGNWMAMVDWVWKVLDTFPAKGQGSSTQVDAQKQEQSLCKVVSTDPPYYDNIGYADISDFFYVWLRRSLRRIYPSLFATVAVPKTEELIASPSRHGGRAEAEAFFLDGMGLAMQRLAEQTHSAFPVTIYYAFKQSETEGTSGTASTGWETFLEAVIEAGFGVSGTWPLRTEMQNRQVAMGTNALASSIVLVCRPRPADAPTASRREFLTALRTELPTALVHLQRGNIAPVDLAQAAIGPGMAVYTRYAKVLDADGERLTVREALTLINQALDEVLAEQEGHVDADTRWALAWFEQHGFEAGEYGVAETLSKAKNTSVSGMVQAGFLRSAGGQVRLLTPDELAADWDPARDTRLTVWESVHQLVRTLETGGERIAAQLVRKLSSEAEMARDLAYRLYTMCERKKWAREAFWYNSLVQSWPEIIRLSQAAPESDAGQPGLFAESEG
jgi:putative DNA methylase